MSTMSKKIRITEAQYKLLESFNDELTYYKFYTGVVNFLSELLENPSVAQPDENLKSHGITRDKLIQGLIDRNVLVRNNKVTELPSDNGKLNSKMLVKYSVLRKNFERNLHRLHIELCECSRPQVSILDEDGGAALGGFSCSTAMQGTANGVSINSTAGQYDAPVGGIMKRKFWYAGNKENKKSKKK